jgi:tetratricopeptide (TPR) repeat protein
VELWSGQTEFPFENLPAAVILAQRSPEAAARRQRVEAEIWFQRGLDLEQQNAPLTAVIDAYRKAAELDSRSAGALVNLGTIYFNQHNWKEAERYYIRALEADPEYALAHFNLANLYDERGDRRKAFEHYESAIRLKPAYADAHYNVALLYQSAGQLMKAVKHWKQYLKLDPASNWAGIARRELKKIQDTMLTVQRESGESITGKGASAV